MLMEVHIYSVKAKSQVGDIWVKDIIKTARNRKNLLILLANSAEGPVSRRERCWLYIYIYDKCDWASDLWQQLELASEFESDLQDMVDWDKKWLVDFNAGKAQLVSFDRSNNHGSTDAKIIFKLLGF